MKYRAGFHLCVGALLAASARAQSIYEDFDDTTSLPQAGWVFVNASFPVGTTGWYQGNLADFTPHASLGFIETDYTCGSGLAVQNNWLLLPVRPLQNGETLQFWTRTLFNPAPYPDRLQVRLSTSGASTNVGTPGDPTSVGDFRTLLLDINPTYSTTEFPGTWTSYTIVLSGLPVGGAPGRLALRYFVENGGPLGVNGAYIGIDSLEYLRGGAPSGACCLADGSCLVQTGPGCGAVGGTYRGDGTDCATANCPPPPTGSCCHPDGSCQVLSAAQCVAAFGVYGGNGSVCSIGGCLPFGFVETTDAGGMPGSAAIIGDPGTGPLTRIFGHIDGDVDMYRFRICDRAAFSASTLTGTLDTQLFLFDSTGKGVVMDDDGPAGEPGSIITGALVATNGDYFLALSLYNRDPLDVAAHTLWNNTNPSGGFYPEWAPNGLGAANPIGGWTGPPSESGAYIVTLTGACFLGAPCYANCDNSTSPPILNANDFQCFLNKYSVQDTLANCDGSTTTPTLTANDFQCYLNAYAAGCS